MKTTAESFDDLIEEKFPGRTLEDVAARVGLSVRGLWNIRTGRVKVQRTTLIALAAAFKMKQERIEAAITETKRLAR